MPVLQLTDTLLATLACPAGRVHVEYFDTLLKGLYVDLRANGRMAFRVRYRQQGRQRVHTLGDARVLTVAEAREQARAALRRVLAGGDAGAADSAPCPGPTLASFYLQQYLPYVKSYKRSWATDECIIRLHLLPALGQCPLGSIKPPDIARLVDAMKTRGYAAGTINRVLVLLRYGFTLARRWHTEGVLVNPALELRNLQDDNRIERYLSAGQTEALLRAVRGSPNPVLASIIAFLLFTGARKREALDARWQDIDWAQALWRIPRTKSGKVRHVPLSLGALQLLRSLQARADTPWLFANPKTGRPFVSIFCSWHTARSAAGLPALRIHDLRHSFASFLVNAGRSLYEVQELLGHADIRTTSRYAHLSRERLREAVEAVPVPCF